MHTCNVIHTHHLGPVVPPLNLSKLGFSSLPPSPTFTSPTVTSARQPRPRRNSMLCYSSAPSLCLAEYSELGIEYILSDLALDSEALVAGLECLGYPRHVALICLPSQGDAHSYPAGNVIKPLMHLAHQASLPEFPQFCSISHLQLSMPFVLHHHACSKPFGETLAS
eukprot:1153162-Pelagomonas_calceolata.AAC.5